MEKPGCLCLFLFMPAVKWYFYASANVIKPAALRFQSVRVVGPCVRVGVPEKIVSKISWVFVDGI